MSTVVFASGRAWVRRAFPVSSAIVRASSSIRGSSASASSARVAARRFRRGIMRDQAGNASAAAFTARATSSTPTARDLGDRPAVRWIFDLKHLARRALDPLPADQHERTFLSAAASLRVCVTAVMTASIAPHSLRANSAGRPVCGQVRPPTSALRRSRVYGYFGTCLCARPVGRCGWVE